MGVDWLQVREKQKVFAVGVALAITIRHFVNRRHDPNVV